MLIPISSSSLIALLFLHFPNQIGAPELFADWLKQQRIPGSDREWPDHHEGHYSFYSLIQDERN